MLLPCWGRSKSTNANMVLYNQFNHMYSLMGTISSQNLQYADIHSGMILAPLSQSTTGTCRSLQFGTQKPG